MPLDRADVAVMSGQSVSSRRRSIRSSRFRIRSRANDFREIAGFIPGDAGKSGLYATQARHDLVIAFTGGIQLRPNLQIGRAHV